MNAPADPDSGGVADRIAGAVRRDAQSHWSVDRRVSIDGIVAFVVAAFGYVYMAGTLSQSFADVKTETVDHALRIRGLEVDLGQTNTEVAVVKGKIEGLDGKLDAILGLLQNTGYHPPHRPTGAP
jgi:hypothetical protein